jgi:hypothetical protein
MTDDELDNRITIAENNWQDVTQGDPRDNEWGFYSYGDAPAALGGGVGGFVWFPNRNEMFRFVRETLPYSPLGQSGSDLPRVAAAVASIVDRAIAGSLEDDAAIQELNRVLKTFSQITWMGTYEELKSADSEFPRHVRRAFFEDCEPSSPIHLPQLISDCHDARFRDFLCGWGV